MARSNRKSKKLQDAEETAPQPAESAPAEPAVEITTRDISSTPDLNSDQWPSRVWPVDAGPRGDGFQVVIKRSVLNAIHRHGHVNTEVEICGVLVGNVWRDDKGPYLLVDSIIRGDFAGSANAQVTFTAETWNHIQRVMEQEHPEAKIVGWYHTHPGFGIFLSDMDLFIHGHFFNMPWQVAFVYDPVSGEEGVFLAKDGKTERGLFITLEDAEREVPTVSVSPEITAAALADFSRRTQTMERRFKMLVGLVVVLLVVIAVYPAVLWWVLGNPRGQEMKIIHQATSQPATQQVAPVAAVQQPAVVPAATQVANTKPSLEEIKALLPKEAPATPPVVEVKVAAPATSVAPATQVVKQPVFSPAVIRPKTETGGAKVLDGPSEEQH